MMTNTGTLTTSLDDAHEHALVALTDVPPRPAAAIAWLSGHLAAVERVLHPRIRQHDPRSSLLREQQRATRRLLQQLRELEQVCTGARVPPRSSLQGLRDDVVDALVAHAVDERLLVDGLLSHTSPAEAAALHHDYLRALHRGPTRPHPSRLQGGRLGPIVHAAHGVRDRWLDRLDGRTVPLQRRPPDGETSHT